MDLIAPTKPKGFRKMSIVFGNGKNTNARNSRDIWKYLKVKTGYARWINRRIKTLNAKEDVDFVVGKNAHENFTEIDYVITDDFAKHLGMLERNDKGEEVREYFIYMEKLARYMIEKKMQDCFITVEKKETKLLGQLETAHNEIRTLQLNERKTYKDGFMALSKYKAKNNIPLTIETMFDILSKYDIVENRDVTVSKKFLIDETFGRQKGDAVIEFNSRSLDLIFRDYIKVESNLFD